MAKVFTSKKNILSIEEFMKNYIGVTYDEPDKLTHKVMNEYLIEKKGLFLNHINFKKVTKTTIATGNHLLVKDNNNQVLIYENPKAYSLNQLMRDLSNNLDSSNLRKIRNRILEEQGYKEITNGEVVEMEAFSSEEKVTCKVNRQKIKQYR